MWWCIPGAPLPGGRGWRIWYARPGVADFAPRAVVVMRADGSPVATTQNVDLRPPLAGLNRRIAIVDVLLETPEPGCWFDVRIPDTGGTHRWSTLPSHVPDEGLSFLLISCFWLNDDRDGALSAAVQTLVKRERPAFKLHVGDQLYMDWPASYLPGQTAAGLTAQRYAEYWNNDPYRDALAAGPSFFVCDDHEYWNDYPEHQIHLRRTQSEENRAAYGRVSEDYYQSFLRRLNPDGARQPWTQFDLAPASFFIADTRSERTYFDGRPNPVTGPDRPQHGFLSNTQWQALEGWQRDLTGPGILVLGQPLFQEDGDWKDHSLSNFPEDYGRLMDLFERSHAGDNHEGAPHDILVLSGDIHTGRRTRARTTRGDTIHELIASPASCVGPFTASPTPIRPPAKINGRKPDRPGDTSRPLMQWQVERQGGEYFETVDNNVGVIRLFPARRHPYSLRVEFDLCFVRKAHQPPWTGLGTALAFWRDEAVTTPGKVLNANASSFYLR